VTAAGSRRTAGVRVVIVAEHASTREGGEAVLPVHYFRLLRSRGIEAWLVVHARSQRELMEVLPDEVNRMHFVPDRTAQRWLHRIARLLPGRVTAAPVDWMVHVITGFMQRRLVRKLVETHGIDVVHEPAPVSPKRPSFMFGLGAPVVIGPMNGGMTFPPAFSEFQGPLEPWLMNLGRSAAQALNVAIPGKRRAAILLVANERTRCALPKYASERVIDVMDNGVDLSLFRSGKTGRTAPNQRVKFVFLGRLVDLKRVDLLLEATSRASQQCDLELHIIGDGPMRQSLEAQTQALALMSRVVFHGQVAQARCPTLLAECDVLVLPSLRECGGAVVLEAMAMGLPVVAANWGGPADYLDERTGILVDPAGHEPFVEGLTEAMVRLAASEPLRKTMGKAGRQKVVEFDWERKIDRILEIYAEAIRCTRTRT
jgi:glycosyltransferase involved in cell wall biosynthesis